MAKWRRFLKSNKGAPRPPKPDLESKLMEAARLLERDDTAAALDLLEPLAAANPRVVEVQILYAQALTQDGDPRAGLAVVEQARQETRDPRLWWVLAPLYDVLDMPAHALHALQQVAPGEMPPELRAESMAQIAELSAFVQEKAAELKLPVARASEALREFEKGALHVADGDYPAAVAAIRRGIRIAGNIPTALNNLSLALFLAGQPQEALAEARRVLAQDPQNAEALYHTIRILAWTGNPDEARSMWEQARTIVPADVDSALALAEAAAVLDDDPAVARLLQPFDKPRILETLSDPAHVRFHILLGVAEANLGETKKAKKHLRVPAEAGYQQATAILDALKAGASSLGFTGRFSYYLSIELIPLAAVEDLISLTERHEQLSERRFRKEVDGLIARYPQLILLAEKQIWDEGDVEAGLDLLEVLNTPAAHAALRRFGTSQAGKEAERLRALQMLADAGAAEPGETFSFWSQGEWRDIQLRSILVAEESDVTYSERAAQLMNDGLAAYKADRGEEAERLFLAAISEAPRAKEAYNNLGTIYTQQGDRDRAYTMYETAVEIDPGYVFPRVNIALLRLADDDVDGAEEMLRPLTEKQRFLPSELAFYQFGMARIAVAREQFDDARRLLEGSLAADPGLLPARDLAEQLKQLASLSLLTAGFERLMEDQRKREQASRARQQAKLTTAAPTVAEVMGLYNVETLKAMARDIAPYDSVTALRKAEVYELLVTKLLDEANIRRMIASTVDDKEHAALRFILAAGGAVPRAQFVARFGDDAGESPYWRTFAPQSTLGKLRYDGMVAETTVAGVVLVAVPTELRPMLTAALG